jgi:acetyl esterase/lipase
MGDSAGGNVSIALVLYVLKTKPDAPVPSSILLISPCADATNSNPQIQITNRLDPILTEKYTGDVAKTWAKGLDLSDPLVSPVLDDLSPLLRRNIPLHGIVGTYDVLSPDAIRLLEKAQSSGLSGRWLVWEKQMHCFPLAWYVQSTSIFD